MDWLVPYAVGLKAYPYYDIEPDGWIAGDMVDLLWYASVSFKARFVSLSLCVCGGGEGCLVRSLSLTHGDNLLQDLMWTQHANPPLDVCVCERVHVWSSVGLRDHVHGL